VRIRQVSQGLSGQVRQIVLRRVHDPEGIATGGYLCEEDASLRRQMVGPDDLRWWRWDARESDGPLILLDRRPEGTSIIGSQPATTCHCQGTGEVKELRRLGETVLAVEAVESAIADAWRQERGRIVATLIQDDRRLGPRRGMRAWLTTTSRNRALDRLRRRTTEAAKLRETAVLARGGAERSSSGILPILYSWQHLCAES
jgi:hypothetical protein